MENKYTLKFTFAIEIQIDKLFTLVWVTSINKFSCKYFSIKLCLIEFVLKCIYIEDDNRFMFSTEIYKGWKPDVDIDDVKFGTRSDN
jgi:hypothetical protein